MLFVLCLWIAQGPKHDFDRRCGFVCTLYMYIISLTQTLKIDEVILHACIVTQLWFSLNEDSWGHQTCNMEKHKLQWSIGHMPPGLSSGPHYILLGYVNGENHSGIVQIAKKVIHICPSEKHSFILKHFKTRIQGERRGKMMACGLDHSDSQPFM